LFGKPVSGEPVPFKRQVELSLNDFSVLLRGLHYMIVEARRLKTRPRKRPRSEAENAEIEERVKRLEWLQTAIENARKEAERSESRLMLSLTYDEVRELNAAANLCSYRLSDRGSNKQAARNRGVLREHRRCRREDRKAERFVNSP
jgi:hypothetical protein